MTDKWLFSDFWSLPLTWFKLQKLNIKSIILVVYWLILSSSYFPCFVTLKFFHHPGSFIILSLSLSLSDLNIVLCSESRLSVNYFSIHLTMWVWERNCLTSALNGPHSNPLMLKLTWVPLFISAARQISTQWIPVTKDSASKKHLETTWWGFLWLW